MTSQWLADLAPDIEPLQEMHDDVRADIAIVGGGFVGLWTAIHVKQLEPAANVVVIEMARCGHGASGLNGGFVMSWWPKIASLCRVCGDDDAVWLADQTTRSVANLGEFLEQNGIDAEFVEAGWLWTATTPAHIGAWDSVLETAARLGRDAIFQSLPADDIARRTGSRAHLAGVFEAINGTVHPAKLARGLAVLARKIGVTIYEHTRVSDIDRSRPGKSDLREPDGPRRQGGHLHQRLGRDHPRTRTAFCLRDERCSCHRQDSRAIGRNRLDRGGEYH